MIAKRCVKALRKQRIAGKLISNEHLALVQKVLAQSESRFRILQNYKPYQQPKQPGIIDKAKTWVKNKFSGTDQQKEIAQAALDEMFKISDETTPKVREVIDVLTEAYGYQGTVLEKWFKEQFTRFIANKIKYASNQAGS